MTVLDSKINVWRRECILQILVEGWLCTLSIFAGLFLLLFFLDFWLVLSQPVRLFLFLAACMGGGMVIWRRLWMPFGRVRPPILIERISQRYPVLKPYLRTAWEFKSRGLTAHVSADLAQAHIVQTEKKLGELPEETVFSWKPSHAVRRQFMASVLFGGLGLPWMWGNQAGMTRVAAPWKDVALEEILEISPGSSRIPWSSDVVIRARSRKIILTDLKLLLREPDSSWRTMPWDSSSGFDFTYQASGLTTPLEYQILWKDYRSRKYSLIPVPHPHLQQARIRVTAPSYTRRLPEILEGLQDVSAFQGSWVEISGRPDRPLHSARLTVSTLADPIPFKPVGLRGEYRAAFPVQGTATFSLEITDQEGVPDPRPPSFQIKILPDIPPAVTILSPSFEVEVSPKERLPITYEAKDDIGLGSLELVYQGEGGSPKAFAIRKFEESPSIFLGDYLWNVSSFPSGTNLTFYLRVLDNNAFGVQEGVSQKIKLHLVDFEGQHLESEERLLGLEKKLSSLVEKEKDLVQALDRKTVSDPEMEKWLQELQKAWSEAVRESEEMSAWLQQDPYINPGFLEQMNSLSQWLKSLDREQVSQALEAARAGKRQEAVSRHEKLAQELQSAVDRMKQGLKFQAFQDFWGEAQGIRSQSEQLTSALSKVAESSAQVSETEFKELQDLLGEIQKKISGLAQTLNSLPKPAPGSEEEKQRKIIRIPIGSSQGLSQALARALESRDMASALQIARQLTEELNKLERALEEANQAEWEEAKQEAEVSKKLAEVQNLWQEILEGQAGQVEDIRRLQEQETQEKLDFQRKILAHLEARQREILQKAKLLSPPLPGSVPGRMQEVLSEFEKGHVSKAPALLRSIVRDLDILGTGNPPRLLLRDGEKEILVELEKASGMSQPPSDALGQKSRSAFDRQKSIRSQSAQLKTQMEDLGLGGVLPESLAQNLFAAQSEMSSAENSLQQVQIPGALEHSSKALEKLEQGLRDFGEAMQKQKQIERGMSGAKPQRSGMARPAGAGRAGFQVAPVRLPSSEEYRPPEEMRKEVL
ncbi:MAG: DUF4175 family protein, partial [Elusimicrobia bacterium]|nr:DUF4175 family protein [Elusimicrobiota bacterium]